MKSKTNENHVKMLSGMLIVMMVVAAVSVARVMICVSFLYALGSRYLLRVLN